MRHSLRPLLVCAAFSCFCFLNTWVEFAQPGVAYSARWNPLQVTVPAVVALQSLITGVLFGTWVMLRRRGLTRTAWAQRLFLLACVLPAGIASLAAIRLLPLDSVQLIRKTWFWPAALGVLMPVAGYALWRPRRFGAAVREFLLYSTPVLLVLGMAGVRATFQPSWLGSFTDPPLASRLPAKPGAPRVVWLIFDGLSEALTFAHRPARLSMPSFDRLRAHSFMARAASSPSDSTDCSLPSLILGERIVSIRRQGPDRLMLKAAGRQDEFSWTSEPNVFSDARRMGLNTALAGWYHPYGRLWNPQLTASAWTAGWLLSGVEEPSQPLPLPEAMLFRLRLQVAAFPLLGHLPGYHPGAIHAEEKGIRFRYLMENARRYVGDTDLGVVVLHLPVPHPPAIKPGGSYLDSMADADRALGEIERLLPPKTTLIVSADHGWRPRLWRGGPDWTDEEESLSQSLDTSEVPFLVRFTADDKPVEHTGPIETVITRRLIGDILQGKLHSAAELAQWQNEVDHETASQAR